MNALPRLARKAATLMVAAAAAMTVAVAPAAVAAPALSQADKSVYDNNGWLAFDTGITPGMSMRVGSIDGDATRCSAGFLAKDRATDRYTLLTAGHCFNTYGPSVWYSVAGEDEYRSLGTVAKHQNREETGKHSNFETDYAIFDLTRGNKATPKIAGEYTVSTVYDRSDLKLGMELCKYGYRTEETCGKIIGYDDTFVRAEVFTLSGDSGSPAFVKLDDGTVAAVGLLSGSPRRNGVVDDNVSDFALVAPVAADQGLEIVTKK